MESFLIRNTFGHKLYELYKLYKLEGVPKGF